MKIVSFTICPFVQRVTGILESKGLPYDIEFISLANKPSSFLEVSPHGQVPVLIANDGRVIHESEAIAEFLEELGPPLLSPDPVERAQDRAWSILASKNYLVQCSMQRSKDAAVLKEREAKFRKALSTMQDALPETPFFRGATVGMVDVSWLPLLHRASIIERHTGHDVLSGMPRAKRWQQHVLDTGLAERSVASDFEEKFVRFYLPEETFLGRQWSGRDERRRA